MMQTLWAVIHDGKIELSEPANLPEGSKALVTLLPEEEKRFWAADDLDRGDDISPLVPHEVYQVSTPYGIVGVGDKLLEALADAEKERQ